MAVERVKEYSELPPEGPEYVEPRPPTDWPSKGAVIRLMDYAFLLISLSGAVTCEDLIIRYAVSISVEYRLYERLTTRI